MLPSKNKYKHYIVFNINQRGHVAHSKTPPPPQPVIWIDCGIHAREWVSPPTCLHAINSLVQDSNSVNPRSTLICRIHSKAVSTPIHPVSNLKHCSRDNLLSAFDFYVLSVANPDGYVYSRGPDRSWRKNRWVAPLRLMFTGPCNGESRALFVFT